MRTLSWLALAVSLVVLTGGAAAPDIVPAGRKFVSKDMRVDPAEFGRTHFVFVFAGGQVTEVNPATQIRAYMWETRVYAAPLARKDAIQKAAASRNHEEISKALVSVPRSPELEGRETVPDDNPTHKIEVRYRVTGIAGDAVTLSKTRKVFDRSGKLLTPDDVKKARRSYAALLAVVGGVGVVGLGFVVARRWPSAA